MPRPASVSNAIHASVTPSASAGGSVVRKPRGRVCGERALEHRPDLRRALDAS